MDLDTQGDPIESYEVFANTYASINGTMRMKTMRPLFVPLDKMLAVMPSLNCFIFTQIQISPAIGSGPINQPEDSSIPGTLGIPQMQ